MIEVRKACQTFNKNTPYYLELFNNLSLTINDGDFISLIGSNGAGKSTLLNMLAGSFMPDSGEIFFDEKNVTRQKEYVRAKYIGRVFQDPKMGNCPDMSIRENLSIAYNKMKSFNLTRGVERKNEPFFMEQLETFKMGLEGFLSVRAGSLSGGQRQALSLLMATITEPKLLLLDEHTAALDPVTSKTVMEKTKEIVETKKITTFMVTHNLNYAIEYGNRLILLHKGEIIFDVCGEEKKELTKRKLLDIFTSSVPDDALSDIMAFG
ncbi:MAG: ATP-binding cassette domain-containing protein [Oscillospiraceae bacterium]|nr:ATP-binding cassette domain-containing protein [Oscillospiraceae bacterium]